MIKISSLKTYHEPTTINHIKALNFNRTATSPGETETVHYIEKILSYNNIQTEIEHFQWSGPLRVLMRTVYILVFSYFLLFRLYLILIIYFIFKNMFDRFRRLSLIKKEESKNIFVKFTAKNLRPNRPLAIVSAHHDSISARLPYKVQVVVFFIYRVMVVFYGLIISGFATIVILDYFGISLSYNFMIVLIIITSLTNIFISIPIIYLLFFGKTSSSGSIDNASGVAISIELAKSINENPLENIDVLFIWTGAEEWGLKGSKKFCKNHFKVLDHTFDLDKSFNINIDMVGSYIGLIDKSGFIIKRKMNRELNDIIEATANQLNIPLERYNKIIRPQSDYKTFKKYAKTVNSKFQVSCFHSSRDSKYIHSVRDTPDKCSVEVLNGCLNICNQTLRSIDLREKNI